MPATTYYKYLSNERLDVLENLQIRFSQFSALNDPHECMAAIDWERFFSQPGWTKILQPQLMPPNAPPNFARMATAAIELVKERGLLKEALEAHGADLVMRRRLDDSTGVLSLTTDPLSSPMWAFYADKHQGFCIGLDGSMPPIDGDSKAGTHILTVKYEKEPALVAIDETPERAFQEAILATKPTAWAFEREVRAVRGFGVGQLQPIGKDCPLGFSVYLHPIPPQAVREIIIGARAANETIQRIRVACKKHGIAPAMNQVKLCPGSYSLELQPLQL